METIQVSLQDYVLNHTQRGSCQCGQCIDAPDTPREPTGHTVDLVFFKVAVKGNPSPETLRELVLHHGGDYGPCNPLDGKEHNYMELGAWVGDQGLAMQLMGLGAILGLWKLFTPYALMPGCTREDALKLSGIGLLVIQKIDPVSQSLTS